MTQPVLFETLAAGNGKQIGVVTLNVEKTINSLSLEMVNLIYPQLQAWQEDSAIACVFIQGAGQKGLCAGGDVQMLYQSAVDNPGGPCEYAETFFEREYRLDYLLHTYSKPVVCWGHGIVMGGGLGILAGCSHRVVTEKTRMAMPEVTIALYPDVGGSWFLNRMPGKTGLFLALTASSMNGPDCIFTGVADRFIVNELKDKVIDGLQSIDWSDSSEENGVAITTVLREFEQQSQEQKPQANVQPHFELIQSLSDQNSFYDTVEAICAYAGDDPWLQKAAAALQHGSAISACNIYRAQQLTLHMSLKEVFEFELMLSTNVVRHPEFAEGVRALLIDKDKNPRWQYQSVRDVPESLLEQMVTPPWESNPLADL